MTPALRPRPRISHVLAVAWLAATLLPRLAAAQSPDSTQADSSRIETSAPSDTASAPATLTAPVIPEAPSAASMADDLRDLGFENITVGTGGPDSTGMPPVAYEDRRYRHAATELGLVSRKPGGPLRVFERRLGLTSAAIDVPGDGSMPTRVVYPSEGSFPRAPSGPLLRSTRRSLDLLVGPLFTYELPRIFTETQVRIELQPELRFNPWPGGRGRLAMIFPVRNDFEPDSLHPDVDRVRPGPMTFEQYGWSPGSALVSACGGLFGNNRYGLSFGVARPLRGGEFLIDSQADVTGFFAASDSGLTYSSLGRWTGFFGVSYRPPKLDLNVHLRAVRFLEKDQGIELEVSRLMGDFEVTFDYQRTHIDGSDGFPGTTLKTGVVKLTLPIAPMDRPTGRAIRVLPVERYTFNYHEESEPVGLMLSNVASREDFLRQLDRSAIRSEPDRWEAAREGRKYRRPQDDLGRSAVSWVGMSGFVNTPWAGVLADKAVEFGYNKLPKEASYLYRGVHPTEVYYGAFGFLPHTEIGLRWTVMPGSRAFAVLVPESKAVDRDRMFSARFELLQAKKNRPGLAIGAEDFHGTKRFHSSYAVLGLPLDIYRLQSRVTLGYAPRVFRASNRTLDGLFGACEVSVVRRLVTAIEYDTEKPNASLGVDLGFGFRARAALFDLKHPGVGAGWYKAL